MGKISPVSIKYTIKANFYAEGSVEKPDVIGALFGQTEGLLGEQLEMRELQKEGKIGRIDVNLQPENGKTIGKIEIPTALDKAETALIAAAIETIERIGPTEAKIEVDKIEDVRGEKRNFIVDRAKKLLESIEGSKQSREIADNLKEQSRMSKFNEYGDEKLPAGDISGHEIIVVEGRADVINLLKNNVENVIGMNGTKLPETIKQLSYDKQVTLFVDGDRGGKLIARNVCDNARVDYIAVAPDGKEVEELVGKEILIALRRKVNAQEFFREFRQDREQRYDSRDRYRDNRENNQRYERRDYRDYGKQLKEEEKSVEMPEREITNEDKENLSEMMAKLEDTKNAYLLDRDLKVLSEASSKRLGLMRMKGQVYAIVMDGKVTSGIVEAAEEAGVKLIVAKNFAYTNTKIRLLSL